MDAVKYVLENVNPIKVLEYYDFENICESESQIRSCCKIHEGNNPTAFCWNKMNNLWCCYTGECGGGDAITLVQKLENCNFYDAVKKLSFILGLDIADMQVIDTEDRIKKEHKRWLNKQVKRKAITNEKEYELPQIKYYDECDTFKRFDKEILEHYNSKFANIFPTGNYMLYNKLVIPVTNDGKIVGVALRDTTGKFEPKWFYYPHIKVGNLLYNLDTVKELITKGCSEIILVEGIFDVWAYHRIGKDNVVAIFGSALKDEQKKILLRMSVDYTLSFDNDEAGNKCTNQCLKDLKNYATLNVVTLPKGKDPCDCTGIELLNAYENKQKG